MRPPTGEFFSSCLCDVGRGVQQEIHFLKCVTAEKIATMRASCSSKSADIIAFPRHCPDGLTSLALVTGIFNQA
jgi:hypothetical protein